MLRDLDRGQSLRLLDRVIDDLPKIPKNSRWVADVHFLTWLAAEAGAWQSLAKAARQTDVEIRMEVMEVIEGMGRIDDEAIRRQKREFLAGFLNDDTVRNAREKDEEERYTLAGSDFPRLEVRDFAAMKIAAMLETGDRPNKGWTKEQWAALREKVRLRLLREGVPR